MGFDRVDSVARKLGVSPESHLRLEAAVAYGLRSYASEGHAFAPLDEFCVKAAEFLDADTGIVRDVIEDMSFSGDVQLTNLGGRQVLYFYGFYRAECTVAGKLAALAEPAEGLAPIAANPDAMIKKAGSAGGIQLSRQQATAAAAPLRARRLAALTAAIAAAAVAATTPDSSNPYAPRRLSAKERAGSLRRSRGSGAADGGRR